jgi:LysR family transcriptional regulator, carnitine catabolism transcriptional activator
MRNNVNLVMLRLFVRVATTLSFSETARLKNVSQPALSRTIRQLEAELGVKLFDRDTRNVTLTQAGEQLLPIAERLLHDYDLAFTDLALVFSGQRGRVTVGAIPSIAAGILPRIIARFSAERPHVEVRVQDDLSDRLLRMLEERRIDFAITNRPTVDRLAFEPLVTDDFMFVCPRGHALDGRGPISWAELEAAPFIAMAPESSVRRLTDAAFVQAGISIRPLYECAHLATVGGLLGAGLGVSALPATTLGLINAHGCVSRPLINPTMTRPIGFVTLAAQSQSPLGEAFMSAVRSDFSQQVKSPAGATRRAVPTTGGAFKSRSQK